jgi:acyl phosphate:glycerol-3-phosphate acyltransferase
MRLAGLLLFAYLAGSINFAIITLRLLGKEDPRTKFSGNAGTTNVYRQAGKGWAALVLLLDVGRAASLAALALALLPAAFVPWIGLVLVAGNRFPCFHRFRGGKGVAGYLGFAVPIAPWGAAAACLAWVAVHRIVPIPFIASFFMILILGGAVTAAGSGEAIPVAGTAATVALIVFNHKINIAALIEERRRGERGQEKPRRRGAPEEGGTFHAHRSGSPGGIQLDPRPEGHHGHGQPDGTPGSPLHRSVSGAGGARGVRSRLPGPPRRRNGGQKRWHYPWA